MTYLRTVAIVFFSLFIITVTNAMTTPAPDAAVLTAQSENQSILIFPHKNSYAMPTDDQNVIGEMLRVPYQAPETWNSIAAQYDVAVTKLKAANRKIEFSHLKNGAYLWVPKQYILPPKELRHGIVINIPELRIYYFDERNKRILTFPVALGRMGWRTPLTTTSIIAKQKEPTWYAPKSIRAEAKRLHNIDLPLSFPPGPDNPLGHFALILGRKGYLIHGTNHPSSVGNFVSSGCVRMYAEDIETLFNAVEVGTPVTIVQVPNKVGMRHDMVFLEVHPALTYPNHTHQDPESALRAFLNNYPEQGVSIDWAAVKKTAADKTGAPTIVGYTVS